MLTDSRVIINPSPVAPFSRPPFASISILYSHLAPPVFTLATFVAAACRPTTTPSLGTDVAALTARPSLSPCLGRLTATIATTIHYTTSLVALLGARLRLSLSLSLSLIALIRKTGRFCPTGLEYLPKVSLSPPNHCLTQRPTSSLHSPRYRLHAITLTTTPSPPHPHHHHHHSLLNPPSTPLILSPSNRFAGAAACRNCMVHAAR
jgi:hypothetical protein